MLTDLPLVVDYIERRKLREKNENVHYKNSLESATRRFPHRGEGLIKTFFVILFRMAFL
jgi:hypothetical protein